MNRIDSQKSYSQYLTVQKQGNDKVRNACDILGQIGLEEDEIFSILEDKSLSAQEVIEIIALGRISGYSAFSGSGNTSASRQIDLMYRNTPWKFVEEFLQNADDCQYTGTPHIEILVDEEKSSVEFVYNEVGFSRRDIWALTAFGQSTKGSESKRILDVPQTGIFYREKTGRKGIGFKSVFSLPAQNIRVHVSSGEFSFVLDRNIGDVLPIWETPSVDDGNTHVTVELVHPYFKVSSIFDELCNLFSAKDPTLFFQKSPVLFMHRLQDVSVRRINAGDRIDSFAIDIQYDYAGARYSDPFVPKDIPVLSGICVDGVYYKKCVSQCIARVDFESGEHINVSCLRETRMAEIDSRYRNISIISPIMQHNLVSKWSKGSLFRTFPMIDNQFDLPFAIDGPFELNSARKGIEYNDVDDARPINLAIISELLNNNGLLEDFLNELKQIPYIRIDYYLNKDTVLLFHNDENRDGSKRPMIAERDLSAFTKKIPLFHALEDGRYISYNDATLVDQDLFKWPFCQNLLISLCRSEKKVLVSHEYADCKIIPRKNVITQAFAAIINEYLKELNTVHSYSVSDYETLLLQYLYPFLSKNEKQLLEIRAFDDLRVFLLRMYTPSEPIEVWTKLTEGKWLHATDVEATSYSFGDYHVIESSTVDVSCFEKVFRSYNANKNLENEFSQSNYKALSDSWKTWEDILYSLKACYFYGYEPNGWKTRILDDYAICNEYDTEENLFRDAGIVSIISKDDIDDLTLYTGDVAVSIDAIKAIGLLNPQKAGRKNQSTDSYELFDKTIRLLCCNNIELAVHFLEQTVERYLSNKARISFPSKSLLKASDEVILLLLKSERAISADSYRALCEELIREYRTVSTTSTNIKTEILIRACIGCTMSMSGRMNYLPSIDISYVIKNRLAGIYKTAFSNRNFSQLRIINDLVGNEIVPTEIAPLIGLLSPKDLKRVLSNEIHFISVDLDNDVQKVSYLLSPDRKTVFLNASQGDYKQSLARYLQTSFDEEKLAVLAEHQSQTEEVLDTIIMPALIETKHDTQRALQIIKRNHPDLTKEEYIKVLSWFRYQSYSTASGNAAKSSEQEIEKDYSESPWHFVYEFIQNVDDCKYKDGAIPSLQITINRGNQSVEFIYNEIGFTPKDIEAITSFRNSQKSAEPDDVPIVNGLFDRENTGKMGRGFKSVFALPGEDIVVHICSNGYAFKFLKRLGQIIPLWEENQSCQLLGTTIRIEGFEQRAIEQIGTKLKQIFCIEDTDKIFSRCPVLYLRKLKSVIVNDDGNTFGVKIITEKQEYSEEDLLLIDSPVSGIKYNNEFREALWEDISIEVISEQKETRNIPAWRYSRMYGDLYAVSITAPKLVFPQKNTYTQGSFYRTLPLTHNTIDVPFAINAPFATDSGRTEILDHPSTNNRDIVCFVCDTLLPEFYHRIREVEGISIGCYVNESGKNLFLGYRNIPELNWREYVRKIDVLMLRSHKGYTSLNQSRALPAHMYSWPCPDTLANSFLPDSADVLVDSCYLHSALSIPVIRIINDNFVDSMNRYLDALENMSPDLPVVDILKEKILPYITNQFDAIHSIYRKADKIDVLKDLRIFGFGKADGTFVRESAANDDVWMNEVPDKYLSFGHYRSLSTSLVCYTPEQIKWIQLLHPVFPFMQAFSDASAQAKRIGSWDGLKEFIKTLLYYEIEPNRISIPYLKSCTLPAAYDATVNVFRDAYLEFPDIGIITRCINENDIIDIWVETEHLVPCDPEDIVDLIRKLGVRKSNDFFTMNQRTIELSKDTKLLLRKYCTKLERANQVVQAISSALQILQTNDETRPLSVYYDDISLCSPALFIALFSNSVISDSDRLKVAEKYFNDELRSELGTVEEKVSLIVAASICRTGTIHQRELQINLSEICSFKIGIAVKEAMRKHSNTLYLNIIRDAQNDPYSSNDVSTALSWLEDASDGEQHVSVKTYQYFVADISSAFPQGYISRLCYVMDSDAVILNAQNVQGSLLAFVNDCYRGKDEDFSKLIEIIAKQTELRNWTGKPKAFIAELARFRQTTSMLGDILYPGITENINNATGRTMDYIIPELLQNINDCSCTYTDQRSLRIELDSSSGEMILSYDEDGFTYANVYSITALGQSSKHDASEGEKGLGFKKVFSLFDLVEIKSNGFSFSLSKEKPTIPVWIGDTTFEGKGTIMRFVTQNATEFTKLIAKWEVLFTSNRNNSEMSPIFLTNIDRYILSVAGKKIKELTRASILEDFHQFNDGNRMLTIPLWETYCNCISAGERSAEIDTILAQRKEQLRTRKKCAFMSDAEFDMYMQSLAVSVCFPRKAENSGVYYSTLPTKAKNHLSLPINLPLELSTGRNEIQDNSTYNKAIFEILFGCSEETKSVFGTLMERAAKLLPDIDVFEYMRKHVNEWIDTISDGNDEIKKQLQHEIDCLRIFHAYHGNGMESLSQAYSAHKLISQYVYSTHNCVIDLEDWYSQHFANAEKWSLIYAQGIPTDVSPKLEGFVRDLRLPEGYFPFVDDGETELSTVLEFFAKEYGSVEMEDDSDE